MLYNRQPDPPQVRHHCRNSRCGGLLKNPTDDRRAAFCCGACERTHYGTRCIVCETAITKKSKRRAVCWRSQCRHALQRQPEKYRLRVGQNAAKTVSASPTAGLGHNAQENSAKSTLKTGPKSGGGWRHIAGPEADPINYRVLAEIPVSKANEAFQEYWRKAKRRAARKALIKFRTPPVNICGGYKFPGAPAIDLSPPSTPVPIAPAAPPIITMIGDDDIPAFLKRAAPTDSAISETATKEVR
jgi:hypothetical protein